MIGGVEQSTLSAPQTGLFGTTVFCYMSHALTHPTTKEAPPVQDGIMVAFVLPLQIAERLAAAVVAAGISADQAPPAAEMHLTLAYLGQVSDIPAEKQAMVREQVLRVAQSVADAHLPLTGKVNGHGIFENGEERAYWATFDSPALPALRQELVNKLNGAGVPISLLHGFTPHITLAYLSAGQEMPSESPGQVTLAFDRLTVAWGGEFTFITPREINMSKTKNEGAAVTEGTAAGASPQAIQDTAPATKALTIPELIGRVVNALYDTMAGTAKEFDWSIEGVYSTFAIVALDGTFYRVDFAVDGNVVSVPKRREWVEVTREWVTDPTPSVTFAAEGYPPDMTAPTATAETSTLTAEMEQSATPATRSAALFNPSQTVVMAGGTLKSMGESEDGYMVTIGGFLVRYTPPTELDSYGHHFSKATDFGPLKQTIVLYDHGQDPTIKARPLGTGMGTLKLTDEGVWFETQLDLREKYERQMVRLAKANKLGLSSGTAPHLASMTPLPTGKGMHIDQWYLGLDASFTVRPAAGPTLTQVTPLKSYISQPFAKAAAELDDPEEAPTLPVADPPPADEPAEQSPVQPHSSADNSPQAPPPQDATQAHEEALPSASATAEPPQGVVSDPLPPEATNAPHPETNTEKNEMPLELEDITKAVQAGVAQATQALQAEMNTIKAALEKEPAVNDPGHAPATTTKAAPMPYYQTRFTDPEVALKQVQDEAAGGGFYAFNHEQGEAFAKAIRSPRHLTVDDERLLNRQVFPPTHINMLLKEGLSVKSIKDMQMVAQGALAGYAMPPMMQEEIVIALPGRTAFRGNGVTVVTLPGETNTYTVTRYKNNSNQYAGMLRGGWASEAGDPESRNYELDQVDIKAESYMFKVVKTMQELQVANLMQMLTRDILNTMVIDEDRVIAIGDGVGKPLGILPGGLNTHGWNVVPSGHASELTTPGIKKLKRGLRSQYRSRGVFVGNSDTYGDVETLTASGTGSDYAFPSLSENDVLLRRPAPECGFMPDVAANAFPLLYCAPEGYYIVEVPGMAIQRMQDTRTSLSKAEIHVLKLIGGRPVEPWCFAVQQVAAS